MIVKDESEVITRCLSTLLPIIDYWVIVDTGSTDGTQKVIEDFFEANGVCGELYERPWVDFSHNRNEAMSLAKGKADYLFFMDADEYLVYDANFNLPCLDKDFYYIKTYHYGSEYMTIQVVNNHLDWKYSGVLHEVIYPQASRSCAILEKVVNIYTNDGVRSRDPQKYKRDAEILEKALREEPGNARYVFYLAQSYRDAGEYYLALENYKKFLEMGVWDQEIFWALYQIGLLEELLEMPPHVFLDSYSRAFQYRNSRIEPLYHMVHFFRREENYYLGYQIAKIAQDLPLSQDMFYVQKWMYDYGILFELSICAYWIEKYEECQQICLELLKKNHLPAEVRACVESNLEFANARLLEFSSSN